MKAIAFLPSLGELSEPTTEIFDGKSESSIKRKATIWAASRIRDAELPVNPSDYEWVPIGIFGHSHYKTLSDKFGVTLRFL